MAQQTVNNGDSGLAARTKINENFTELYEGSGIYIPSSQPEISTSTLTINLDSVYQAMFEPRLSTATRTININFTHTFSNKTNALLVSEVYSLTGTITITFDSDTKVSNASSIGTWDDTLKELEIAAGTDDIIEFQYLRDKTGSQWLLKVSELPLT